MKSQSVDQITLHTLDPPNVAIGGNGATVFNGKDWYDLEMDLLPEVVNLCVCTPDHHLVGTAEVMSVSVYEFMEVPARFLEDEQSEDSSTYSGLLATMKRAYGEDFSEESFAALELASSLIADSSHLHLIHVLPELSATEPGVIWGTIDDSSRMHHAENALRDRLAKPEYGHVDIAIRLGNAGNKIAEYAQEIGTDLIVLPSHGRTGLKRLLIGSVAERVVRLAHCPVLVLRK